MLMGQLTALRRSARGGSLATSAGLWLEWGVFDVEFALGNLVADFFGAGLHSAERVLKGTLAALAVDSSHQGVMLLSENGAGLLQGMNDHSHELELKGLFSVVGGGHREVEWELFLRSISGCTSLNRNEEGMEQHTG